MENRQPLLYEGERLDDLQVNGLHIIQHPGRFRFGTDAVLLQNFAELKKNAKAIDLGTGTGILPILLCARNESVSFDAVEIQADCADMARRSVVLNRMEDRIHIYEMDLKDAPERLGGGYDAVLCNPPYGKKGSVLHNPNDALAIARHEILTDLETVLGTAGRLLKTGGRLFMVHQADRLPEIIRLAARESLTLKRLRLVFPAPGKFAQLVLMDFLKDGHEGCRVLPPLTMQDENGDVAQELQRIYRGEKTV